MIVDKNQEVELTQRGFGRTERMSIDENSLQHIMSVLTNLYSDPAMAVVREYSTNAYDSHVEAGKADVAIDVRLPDAFEPIFKIRDYGVGLSEDEVYNIYGRYGASTKRESNAYVGQLGLGCKSALTLTDQFTMIAIKNGIKNVFNIHLDESGIPSISKGRESITDEGNGVEIVVPIANVHEFRQKAEEFYRFFPGTINFVNGGAVKPVETYMDISDRIKIVQNTPYNVVVMGGVPYRADKIFPNQLTYSRIKFLVYAEVGDVNFTPSREELNYNDKTLQFLAGVEEEVRAHVVKAVQDEVSTAKNYVEAHQKYAGMDHAFMQFVNSINRGQGVSVQYKGIPVPLRFKTGELDAYHYRNEQFHRRTVYSTNDLYKNTVYASKSDSNYVMLRGRGKTFSSNYKNKLKGWFGDNPDEPTNVIYAQRDVDLDAITGHGETPFEGMTIITVEEDLEQYKVASSTSSKKTNVTNLLFDRVDLTYYKAYFTKEQVDTSKPILMVTRKEAHALKRLNNHRMFGNFYNIYVVNKNLRKRFTKEYNKVTTFDERYKPILDELNKKISDSDLDTIYKARNRPSSYNYRQYIRYMDVDAIKDSDLKEYLRVAMSDNSLDDRLRDISSKLRDLFDGRNAHVSNHKLWHRVEEAQKEATQEFTELDNRLKNKYPILFGSVDSEHLTEYVNLIHNKEEEA